MVLKACEDFTRQSVTETDLDSFLLYNRNLKNPAAVPPQCVNCWHITDGVTVIGND
jgi:hypothetical protein